MYILACAQATLHIICKFQGLVGTVCYGGKRVYCVLALVLLLSQDKPSSLSNNIRCRQKVKYFCSWVDKKPNKRCKRNLSLFCIQNMLNILRVGDDWWCGANLIFNLSYILQYDNDNVRSRLRLVPKGWFTYHTMRVSITTSIVTPLSLPNHISILWRCIHMHYKIYSELVF